MKVRCPACQKVSELPDSDAGLTVICVACGGKFEAPALMRAGIPVAATAGAAAPVAGPAHFAAQRRPRGVIVGLLTAAGAVLLLVTWAAWSARSTAQRETSPTDV